MQIGDPFDVPRPFRRSPSGEIELRHGGGPVAWIVSVFFFVAASYPALAALGFAHLHDEFRHDLPPQIPALLSAFFFGFGGLVAFGRRSVAIDVASRTLTRRYSVLVPLSTDQRRLDEFHSVAIELHAGDSESPDRYPVKLLSSAGEPFTISSPADFGESRRLAEFLVRLLRIPLADATTEHETVLSPEHAADNIQQRLKTPGGAGEEPPLPARMRSHVDRSSTEMIITIPRRVAPFAGVVGLLGAAVIFFLPAPAFRNAWSRYGLSMSFSMLLVGVLVFAILPLVSVAIAFGFVRNTVIVRVSPLALTIDQRGVLRTSSRTIAAADILDVDSSAVHGIFQANQRGGSLAPAAASPHARLFPSKGVVIKTRESLVEFGGGLSAAELGYLIWLIRKSLAAPSIGRF